MVKFVLKVAIIIALFAGCKTTQEEPASVPEPVVARRSTVVFKTTSNPTTGYDWEVWIDYDSTGRFALNNIQKEEIYPGAMGSPLRQTVTLRSSQTGRVFVHFIYKRAWEGSPGTGGLGRYIYTFDIAQDLTIKLLDTQRTVNRGYTEDSLPVIEVPEIRN